MMLPTKDTRSTIEYDFIYGLNFEIIFRHLEKTNLFQTGGYDCSRRKRAFCKLPEQFTALLGDESQDLGLITDA